MSRARRVPLRPVVPLEATRSVSAALDGVVGSRSWSEACAGQQPSSGRRRFATLSARRGRSRVLANRRAHPWERRRLVAEAADRWRPGRTPQAPVAQPQCFRGASELSTGCAVGCAPVVDKGRRRARRPSSRRSRRGAAAAIAPRRSPLRRRESTQIRGGDKLAPECGPATARVTAPDPVGCQECGVDSVKIAAAASAARLAMNARRTAPGSNPARR